ncbi:hypothetical protein BO221_11585 [Archangium sp. Cb G35]|uniref:SPW repeat domain-containing protein n=1 Tax=Archangium sp. Cb G35 TaxID=1920190 RepID=UPI000937CABD|nr:hypothetical protein [Archangium sp. Cb G35]OJT25018.1 hypothetical protein BO221_11585 [Archangium sp. Cb G35]
MKPPLSPRIHGYGDYLIVALLALAPTLFGFSGSSAVLCYVLAVAQLLMSLMTAYPLGVAKLIPFTVHGSIEAVVAIFLIIAPVPFGFSRDVSARNFFLFSGVGLSLVWLMTDYKAAERPVPGGMRPRRRARV